MTAVAAKDSLIGDLHGGVFPSDVVAFRTQAFATALWMLPLARRRVLRVGRACATLAAVGCWGSWYITRKMTQGCLPVEKLNLACYRTLKQMNSLERKAPLALWIFPKIDENDAFSTSTMSDALCASASTHRVALRTVGNASELQKTIIQMDQQYGPIDVLCLCGHGDPYRLYLGADSVLSTSMDYRSILRAKSMKSIHLLSCSTGSLNLYPNLAETIARQTGVEVFAPIRDVRAYQIFACSRHGLDTSMKGSLIFDKIGRIFFPNGTSRPSCSDSRESFLMRYCGSFSHILRAPL